MLPRLFVQMAVIFQQINIFLGEHTDPHIDPRRPLSLNGTANSIYDLCGENGFICLGIARPSLGIPTLADCTEEKNCLALALIHHLKERNNLNFYLLTDHQRADLIKLNIFHGNSSTRLSIELNCTDFEQHRPIVQMNMRGHRLPFSTVPSFALPNDLLNLADKYCVWSSETSFFVNDVFRNEASHLYFDFLKRTYDVSLAFRASRVPSATVEQFQIRRLLAVNLVKLDEPTIHFINILLSLNLVCLIGLFTAVIMHKG